MAYALIFLVQILEQDQHHLVLDSECKLHIESLLEEARVLKELVARTGELESLESTIRDVVHDAEDMIEFHVMDQTLPGRELDLSGVIAAFRLIGYEIRSRNQNLELRSSTDLLSSQNLETQLTETPSRPQANATGRIGYDINQITQQAMARWLHSDEILFILENFKEHQLTHQVPLKPTSGSIYLLNKQIVKDIHEDGYSWHKKRNQKTIIEAHEQLKGGLNCYYAHGDVNTNLQRRRYLKSDPLYEHIVLVHYRDIGEELRLPIAQKQKFTIEEMPPDLCDTSKGAEETYSDWKWHKDFLSVPQQLVEIQKSGVKRHCITLAAVQNSSHAASRIQSAFRARLSRERHQREAEVTLAGDCEDESGTFAIRGLTTASKFEFGRVMGVKLNANLVKRSRSKDKGKGSRENNAMAALPIPKKLRTGVQKMQARTKKENSDIVSVIQDISGIDDDSWVLLRWKVFGQDSFSPEIQLLGKRIAKACGDLPLAINLIAAFLSSSKYSQGLWELIVSKVSSRAGIYYNILSVIYNHLPLHLKACFLYIGVFPQAAEIKSSRIIKLWNAEGFVEPTEYSFEETAELYLEGLIGRNLLSVSRKEPGGKVKAIEVDFQVTKFCREKACEENFLWFKNSREHSILDDKERRVSLHPLSELTNNTTSTPRARSFLCMGCASVRVALSFHSMRLLRVLDVFQLEFHRFPKEMLQLLLLRYLAFSCHSDLPSAISRFLNLQTLIIRRLPSSRAFTLPPGLWQLTQLRHVISKETCVWYYPRDKDVLQENLQTLSNIHVFLLTNKFIESILNLKKLGIFCDSSLQTIIGLDCLQKLETLKCAASWSSVTRDFLSCLRFPPSRKKLTLSSCKLPCEFMTVVGSLPNLEHLRLQNSDFLGMGLESESEPVEPEWVPVEGEFIRIRSLLMKELNLVHWRARANHFPCLQRLVIRDCCSMTEIPRDIGEIETLKVIEVDESSPSLLDSANRIKDERSLAYNFLQLHIWKS